MPAILGYWPLRGLCQQINLLLEYVGEDYIVKRYHFGASPNFDRSEWLKEKFTLGFDFPNLPYYIDGNHKITQSNAILRYVARKHDLIGSSEQEVVLTDMLESEAMDARMALIKVCCSPDYEKVRGPYEKDVMPAKLEQFSKFLGEKDWLIGDKITYVDFFLYEVLDAHKIFAPTCLDKFDNLKKYVSRFEALEPIKKYMNSPRFIKGPLHGPMANL